MNSIALSSRIEAPPLVDGRRILATIGVALGLGAAIGSATYLAMRPAADSSVTGQVITVEVYACLVGSLAFSFRPARNAPLAFRYTGLTDLGLAFFTWLASIATASLVYLVLTPFIGNPIEALRKILTVATDVKRLQGQPFLAWWIAIPRGCVLVPVFKELMFRGVLLDWLRKRISNWTAITVSAGVFAVMHVYPVVMPFAFLLRFVRAGFGCAPAQRSTPCSSTFSTTCCFSASDSCS
jgi:membrane protease YdiL (CAAX protease family)